VFYQGLRIFLLSKNAIGIEKASGVFFLSQNNKGQMVIDKRTWVICTDMWFF
jgi:hypothetical protein